jgi:hypothetical protein
MQTFIVDIFDKTIANRAVAFHNLIVLQFSTVLNSWAEGDLYQRCTSAAHAPMQHFLELRIRKGAQSIFTRTRIGDSSP